MKRDFTPEPIHLTGHCYVLLQGNWMHPHTPFMFHNLVWYPERAMSLFQQYGYRPYVKSVVTECPWIVALYDREKVRAVGDDGIWRLPQAQTYCASVTWINRILLESKTECPAIPLDGGKQLRGVLRAYAKKIAKARKLYSLTTADKCVNVVP